MLILNKASVDLCRIRRSKDARIETGLRFGNQLFYPCGSFAPTEMHEAINFYRSCPGSTLIVSDDTGYQVWCHLPAMECVDTTAERTLTASVA
ncbi:hypothetical protein [Gloeobacter kilaueensis]|uniref:Uncharacterized protein n=1 Tax=Gloeobacter kilaueensis (strain ATCC BAA-2537 / CCAP 1431/1 / ULC 316 / JS1) TaxID=1183438 RepID=U5QL01_GLOK1|nr:hypothetical protein [Gloeobacter kilaueensis]AGY58320.1 hypothetical protein GKIL_2074 [Gloeobacter kilaueensis JS1]